MASPTDGQRPFPAVTIVVLLFLACIFASQQWGTVLLPNIAGLARIKLSLIFLDKVAPMPVTIDIILVAGLFAIIYTAILLVYPRKQGISIWTEFIQRWWAVLSGLFILLFCVAMGGMVTFLLQEHLPVSIQNGADSVRINADLNLPYSDNQATHLHGNLIAITGLLAGIVPLIGKIRRTPIQRRQTVKLTREQRMSPYQRMLLEKKKDETPSINSSFLRCRNQPLRSIEPEAVNYRPL